MLYKKIVEVCRKIAKENALKVRQSYKRTVPKLMQAQRFRHHPKNRSKAIKAERKLKTIGGGQAVRGYRKVDVSKFYGCSLSGIGPKEERQPYPDVSGQAYMNLMFTVLAKERTGVNMNIAVR